jgi:DNA gyrase/topoisomerase IV subunit B
MISDYSAQNIQVLKGLEAVRVRLGRCIPVDIHPDERVSALKLVMPRLHAGIASAKDRKRFR